MRSMPAQETPGRTADTETQRSGRFASTSLLQLLSVPIAIVVAVVAGPVLLAGSGYLLSVAIVFLIYAALGLSFDFSGGSDRTAVLCSCCIFWHRRLHYGPHGAQLGEPVPCHLYERDSGCYA